MRSSLYLNSELPHILVSEALPFLINCMFPPVFEEEAPAFWGTASILGASIQLAPVYTDNSKVKQFGDRHHFEAKVIHFRKLRTGSVTGKLS